MHLPTAVIPVLSVVVAAAFAAPGLVLAAVGAAPGPSFAVDRIEIQLTRRASETAWASRLGASGGSDRVQARPLTGASVPTDVVLTRFGISSLDHALASLGDVVLEPEFRGETPPATDDPSTDFTAFYIARWSEAVPIETLVERLRALPEVVSADPIPLLPVAATPNDSLFAESYWFQDLPQRNDIAAPEAWDVTTGDTAIVVGVLDTGVLPYHPDLGGSVLGVPGQIWTNAVEAAGLPNVDDDGNGFVDDVHGWDFVSRPPDGVAPGEDFADPDPDPSDMAGHGTAVAGVVGALTDNTIGVSGTAWNVRLMPLRIGWEAVGAPLGLVDMSYVAQAIRYATRMNVPVINCSFATINLSGLFAAASAATRAGMVIVSAAGNSGQPHDLANRADVIAVGATGPGDVIAGFSNLGDFVDIVAPGVQIATTFVQSTGTDSVNLRQPAYVRIDGTSFSAPLVAGGAALVQSQRRANGERLLDAHGMLLRLTETSDDIAAENPGATGYGAGRLNLVRALTDRPTSTAARAGATTVGPALVMPPDGLLPRVAYAMRNQQMLIKPGQGEDTLSLLILPGTPIGHLAGGEMGHHHAEPKRDGTARTAHASSFAMFVGTSNGRVVGLGAFGDPLPGWPVSTGGVFARPVGGPALGDLDGDGVLEVVAATEEGNLFAWRIDGSTVVNFPVFTGGGGTLSPVAIADLDGDGADEIVVATADGEVHVVRGDGTTMSGWPVIVEPLPFAPVITRFASGEPPVVMIAAANRVKAFYPDGSIRFNVTVPGQITRDPALGDLDADGVDEIVLALDTPAIARLDRGGSLLGTPFPIASPASTAPLVGPITPGGREIVVLEGTDLAAFGADGSRRGPFPKPGRAGFAASLADLDGDGATEITAGTNVDSILYVYDAGSGGWTESWRERAWLTPRGNGERTGSRDVGPPSPVADLSVAAVTESTVTLAWTAPANEDGAERPIRFEIRGAPDSLPAGDFDTASLADSLAIIAATGAPVSFEFRRLEPATRYAFALRSTDTAGNRSQVSNAAVTTTALGGPLESHAGAGIAPSRRPSPHGVELYWRTAAPTETQKITIFDVTGRRVRQLLLPSDLEGIETWDGRDDDGAFVPAGVYFARLSSGSVRVQTRVVLVP